MWTTRNDFFHPKHNIILVMNAYNNIISDIRYQLKLGTACHLKEDRYLLLEIFTSLSDKLVA